jgi:hypothetical protein
MSATYPTGFGLYNNRVPFPYVSWKGQGLGANPIGISSGNIRPQTNQDPLNVATYKQGQARPQKTYRKGTSIVIIPTKDVPVSVQIENTYYSNRTSKSSTSGNLVSQLIDTPGRFIVKPNTNPNIPGNDIDGECKTCSGMGIVSSWYPINNLSEKPEPNVTNPVLCCNEAYKAKRRVLPANTNLPKNYYTTHSQYLYNRCQTYDQRVFNFCGSPDLGDATACQSIQAGSPLSVGAYYVANCNPNGVIVQGATTTLLLEILQYLLKQGWITSTQYNNLKNNNDAISSLSSFVAALRAMGATNPAIFTYLDAILTNPYSGLSNYLGGGGQKNKFCSRVYYKPNNYTFAQQGAVSSSTRTLQQKSQTIESNAASFTRSFGQGAINQYGQGTSLYVLKTKVPKCQPSIYTKSGNPRTCTPKTNDIQNPLNSVYDTTNIAIA